MSVPAAHAALQQGRFDEAERLARAALPDPFAMHLLGLALKGRGLFVEAEHWMRQSLQSTRLAPRTRAEFHNNIANLLAQQALTLGAEAEYAAAVRADPSLMQARIGRVYALVVLDRGVEAVAQARAAVAQSPTVHAWLALAAAARQVRDWKQVETAAAQALKLDPRSAIAVHQRAAALAHQGQWEEALPLFDAMGVDPGAAESVAGALAEAGRFDEARTRLQRALDADPAHASLHRALAALRWLCGEGASFADAARDALRRHPDDVNLRLTVADLLRRGDLEPEAAALLEEGLQRAPGQVGLMSALSVTRCNLGAAAEGVALAERALAAAPELDMFRKNACCARLMAGEGPQALTHARWGVSKAPLDQEWIALQATALRLSGDRAYDALYDYDRFVAPYVLEPPPGYADMAAFNVALAERLRALHLHAAHPLDQSLRGGTQTPVSLLASDDPVIQAFLAALDAPIRAHMARIGKGGAHPLTGRNTGAYQFAGCWSVRLVRGGSHVNHVHPQGWLSSAYYVTVPPDVQDSAGKAGWLGFGEPRFPVPGLGPEHFIQPSPGVLALFPSYMWHGVRPFTAGEERMTIAFDVIPA
jgi:tetratricopeptide (TPR) repeat protein